MTNRQILSRKKAFQEVRASEAILLIRWIASLTTQTLEGEEAIR